MGKIVMPIAHVKVDICKFCEHDYIHPCHGKDKECPNRRFIEGGGAMKSKQQRDPVPAAPEKKGKPSTKKLRTVHIMDDVEAGACSHCGASAWIVDGDGSGKFWLLCIDPKGVGCVECQELPADVMVVE